jgi:hypothetical protein
METADAWRSLFENWPESIPHEGIVVTNFQESISFTDFMISGGILLVQRDQPDTVGARTVMISYDAISAVKIKNALELARYQVMGFQSPL